MTRRVVRIAYILLGVMTVASFGGPLLIGGVLKGGKSPDWPPDRSVEWVAFAGTTGLVLAVMAGLTGIWAANIKELNAAKARLRAAREGRPPAEAEADRGGA